MKQLTFILGVIFLIGTSSVDAKSTVAAIDDGRDKTSLFNYIFQLENRPQLELETDTRLLIKNKLQETYQQTEVKLFDGAGAMILATDAKVRARGNMRKKVSFLPPLKIDFKKSTLDSLGFLKLDDLKLVLPANRSKLSQEKLLQEYFLYELYSMLDSNAIRAKLVDVTIKFKGKVKYQLTGFLVESEADYEHRKNARIIEHGIVSSHLLDRTSFAKMVFFQYMIGNTDFSVDSKHNIEVVKLKGKDEIIIVPYDFDYSGFVNQSYALPHPDLPIEDVRSRYFFSGYKLNERDYEKMMTYYLSFKDKVNDLCEESTYMSDKTISGNKKYLNDFFKLLEKPKRLRITMVK